MTHDYEPDALLLSLARLPSASPTAAGDQRIRARCRVALARRRAARQRATRSKLVLARLADAALTAVLCAYAAVALVEAFRLIE
jgi:hypothetical protein